MYQTRSAAESDESDPELQSTTRKCEIRNRSQSRCQIWLIFKSFVWELLVERESELFEIWSERTETPQFWWILQPTVQVHEDKARFLVSGTLFKLLNIPPNRSYLNKHNAEPHFLNDLVTRPTRHPVVVWPDHVSKHTAPPFGSILPPRVLIRNTSFTWRGDNIIKVKSIFLLLLLPG